MKFSELKNTDKIVDIIQKDGKRLDGQILEYHINDGESLGYLCSKQSMWPICQFNEEDYERYEGNLETGEYIKE